MALMAGRLELSLACATPTPPEPVLDEMPRAAPPRRRDRPTMGELYSELASLLPGLPYRADRADIVEMAAEHVKVLEDTVAVLEAYLAVQTAGVAGAGGEVTVSYRETVCFAARLPAARRGALTRVLEAFDRRGVEVYAATVARSGGGGGGEAAMVTVTAAAAAPDVVEMIKADIAGIE